jgi:hypothetical protein
MATCLLACILGTLFLRLGYHQQDLNSRVGLTFAVLAYWAFGSMTALPLTIFERPVFYMQRDQKYYRTSPYLFSTIVAEVPHSSLPLHQLRHINSLTRLIPQIPTMMVEVGAFSTIIYWLTNLNEGSNGERFGFFVYMSFLFYWVPPPSPLSLTVLLLMKLTLLCAQTMRSFTRMVSVWSPSLLYAQSLAPTFVAMLLMFGGFLVPRVLSPARFPLSCSSL